MTDLKDFIVIYDDAVDRQICDQMVSNFNELSRYQIRNGAGIREGLEDSSWTELNVTALADQSAKIFFESMVLNYFQRYQSQIKLSRPISAITKLSDVMMKHYRAELGDRFQIHFDSIRALSNRYLVFLWYLNDIGEGGETWFPDLDIKISPKAGRLVVFPPYWMFQHASLPPKSGDKFIASTYALY